MLDIFLPRYCFICEQMMDESSVVPMCFACRDTLPVLSARHCSRCLQPFESPLAGTHLCGACLQERSFDQVYCFGPYEGVLADLIRQLKFTKKFRLAPLLGALMLENFKGQAKASYDSILAVPMTRWQLMKRGYNHAQLLAQFITKKLKVPCDRNSLKKIRQTKRQTPLSADERRKNLTIAFKARRSFWGESCLLVDDVFTTGATAEECAHTLKKAGAIKVDVLTAARSVYST
jgi:competence protein ComFC